jgi:hypothetical protein
MDQEQLAREREREAQRRQETDAMSAAVRGAMSKQVEQYQNPDFLRTIQNPDVDTDVYDWVRDELGPALSGSHILGERPRSYADVADLLEQNAAERVITEGNPGRFLREDPELLAIAQRVNGVDDPEFREPVGSRERRVIRGAHDVAAQRKTMSIGGAGRDTVGTVQTEQKTNRDEETKGTAESISERIFG